MHIVSIGMLRETGTLDTFLVSLDRDLDWKQVCILIADETMRQTVSAIRSEPEPAACARFDAIFQGRKSLPSVGGISAGDCTFVLRLLWEDRTSFLTLCERGLLPGCPTLLYTLCRIVLAQPMARSVNPCLCVILIPKPTTFHSADLQPRLIQELCVRPYLSSSNTEKYALRDVCRIASQRAPTMKPIDLGEAVLEDNRVLAGAYIRMVSSRDPNNACFQTADWDGMATLLTHVLFAVRRDSATKRECLVIVEKTISFVWLILANKTHQPDYVCSLSDSHNIWPYFLAIFGSLW